MTAKKSQQKTAKKFKKKGGGGWMTFLGDHNYTPAEKRILDVQRRIETSQNVM